MSAQNDEFDIFDPTGMVKSMRDSSMDAWAKTMVELVSTDAYSAATGKMLDAWLTTSGPFRKALEDIMNQTLASMNMPSRDEVTRLAGRLTNIEKRLDDMDAKLEENLRTKRKSGKKAKSSSEED